MTGKPWWQVLHVAPDAPMSVREAAYRALALQAHPDAGGSPEAMQRLNAAIEQARRAGEGTAANDSAPAPAQPLAAEHVEAAANELLLAYHRLGRRPRVGGQFGALVVEIARAIETEGLDAVKTDLERMVREG